jgi:hypothetical protein
MRLLLGPTCLTIEQPSWHNMTVAASMARKKPRNQTAEQGMPEENK